MLQHVEQITLTAPDGELGGGKPGGGNVPENT
jgi:hypothetical protein